MTRTTYRFTLANGTVLAAIDRSPALFLEGGLRKYANEILVGDKLIWIDDAPASAVVLIETGTVED